MSEVDSLMADWEAMHQEHVRCEESVERRLEPELIGYNRDKALASIAISLKRIADALQPRYATGAAPLVVDFQSLYAVSKTGGHG